MCSQEISSDNKNFSILFIDDQIWISYIKEIGKYIIGSCKVLKNMITTNGREGVS